MRATPLLLAILLATACAGRNPVAQDPTRVKPAPIQVAFNRVMDATRRSTHSGIPTNLFVVTVGDRLIEQQLTTDGRSSLPVWSPDGQRIAFVRYQPSDMGRKEVQFEVHVLNPDTGVTLKLDALHASIGELLWSPDGRTLAVESMRIGRLKGKLVIVENAVHLFDGAGQKPPLRSFPGTFSPSWSPDGQQIALTCVLEPVEGVREYRICVTPSSGSTPPRALATEGCRPRWSPDGKQILYLAPCGQESELFVMNSDGTQARRLGRELKGVRNPAWSPDGEHIVFQSPAQDRFRTATGGSVVEDSFVMARDGTGLKSLGKGWALECTNPVWSPDSVSIVARCNKKEETVDSLYLLKRVGYHKPRRIAKKWILNQTVTGLP